MTGTILDKIIDAKRPRIEAARRRLPDIETVRRKPAHRLTRALSDGVGPNIIAEFKRASPSKGTINHSIAPADAARAYRYGGAAAISVLTEEDFFKGSLNDLLAVREAVDLPVLRKDFVIDEFQIRESAAAGADAVLLIVAALSLDDLERFHSIAIDLGLDALVEVHDRVEMAAAASIGATLIGVNNRNLKTFEVSLDVSRSLAEYAPGSAVLIAESGISTRAEIEELSGLGYSGFLIGESLMRADRTRRTVQEMIGGSG